MRKSIKLVSLALSLSLSTGLFSACGTKKENTAPTAVNGDLSPEKIGYYSTLKLPLDDKNTEISIICDTSCSEDNDTVVVKELRKRTGLNVQLVIIPRSAIKEKAKVLVASKTQMPDLMGGGFTIKEYNDMGMQGAFEPINEHLDELPNLKEIFYDKAKEYGTEGKLKNFMTGDGRLFVYPQYDINRDVNHGFLYRKDVFDKLGIKMWTNKEEFLDALRKLKAAYPNSTPFVSKTGNYIFRDFGQNYGLNDLEPYYDESTKKWTMTATDPKFKEVLDLLRTMYAEGLIDPEFLTATQSAWQTKMSQADKAFVTWDWIGRFSEFQAQTKGIVDGYDLRYAEPLAGKVISLPKVGGGPVVKKSDKSLLAMQLCDYLLSESGATLLSMGIEGETYNIDDEGIVRYVGYEDQFGVGINELEEKYGLYISGLYRRFDRRSSYYQFTEREQEAQDMMNNKKDGYWPEDPILSYNDEEDKIIVQYLQNYKTAALEFATKYVLGTETGDAAWNAWLKKSKTLGEKELLDAYNSAQSRYDKL